MKYYFRISIYIVLISVLDWIIELLISHTNLINRMELRNPFALKVRVLYLDCWECFKCGENGSRTGGLELHHIKGRESASALNAALLCKGCHEHMNHNDLEEEDLMIKSITYAVKYNYQFDEIDFQFYELYKKIYHEAERKRTRHSESDSGLS